MTKPVILVFFFGKSGKEVIKIKIKVDKSLSPGDAISYQSHHKIHFATIASLFEDKNGEHIAKLAPIHRNIGIP